MVSPHSEARERLLRVRETIQQSNWEGAAALAAEARFTLPEDPELLGEYLAELKGTLIFARTARSGLLASLARVRAATKFHEIQRHNLAELVESRRPPVALVLNSSDS